MKRKLVVASALIALCSGVNAHARCMQETFGATICGAGPCSNGRDGRVFCAVERYGAAVLSEQGEIVCGLGKCVQDIITGQIMCSREAGGDAVIGIDGVKCSGGCEPATPAYCERIVQE